MEQQKFSSSIDATMANKLMSAKEKFMKRIVFLSILCMITFVGCDKDTLIAPIPDGVYKGTFIRTHPTEKYAPAEVTLTINGNRFSGNSNTPQYPAICSGTLKSKAGKLSVTNECFFTANFDWTLIFDGEYDYEIRGNELVITKSNTGNMFDHYILEKQ